MNDPDHDGWESNNLQAALDVGLAELDAGLGVETSPDEFKAKISAELRLDE